MGALLIAAGWLLLGLLESGWPPLNCSIESGDGIQRVQKFEEVGKWEEYCGGQETIRPHLLPHSLRFLARIPMQA